MLKENTGFIICKENRLIKPEEYFKQTIQDNGRAYMALVITDYCIATVRAQQTNRSYELLASAMANEKKFDLWQAIALPHATQEQVDSFCEEIFTKHQVELAMLEMWPISSPP